MGLRSLERWPNWVTEPIGQPSFLWELRRRSYFVVQQLGIASMADTDIHEDQRNQQHGTTADRGGQTEGDQQQGQSKGAPPKTQGGQSDEEKKKQQEQDRKQDARRAKARPFVRIGMVVIAVLLIAGGLYYYESTKNIESTDDAYTDGRVMTIAPHVTGYVVSLDVNDNQFVHKGDALIHIDPRDYQATLEQAQGQLAAAKGQLAAAQQGFAVAKINFPARLAQAQAQLKDAEANLFKAQTDYKRQTSLPRAATTGQQVDYAEAALRSADAQVASAQAAVQEATPVKPNVEQIGAQVNQLQGTLMQADAAIKSAQLNLEWCVVRAPQDGWITKRNVEVGNYMQPGAQIFSIVSPDVWITANFKETQLNRMRPGQTVKISVDAYPALKLVGHVDSVQLGSGSKFTAFPPENATGNFVKIVQRVPVKIIIDGGLDPNLPLPLGISVEPTVSLK
jgi:membrane fusion protein (multidrug efflux system)